MTTSLNLDILRAIPAGNQEQLKVVLMGELDAVLRTQDFLAVVKFADKKFWSNPQPIGTSSEYISVLIRKSASKAVAAI
ncbi:hypothetical protein [Pseudanabaena sp. FACHB-2040]|uniref:hypothetical protein n=1 Tax=Pseudanabaena sp. FACHB-2040 TaxID=2692859 RepID=UPI0016867169|nr:hypothetical protein [Pseudanabaena sp. FACHB-2040]MBD2258229.1 hypothetical protein [Pseudanabaena sp. FACHB-2040]